MDFDGKGAEQLAQSLCAEHKKETAEGPGKDVEKAEGKLKQYLSLALDKINDEDEFRNVMSIFLKMASAHPSLTPNKVRLVLISLAKQVAADAKKKP